MTTDHWLVRRPPVAKDWVEDIVFELTSPHPALKKALVKAAISPVWGTYSAYLDRSACCGSLMLKPSRIAGCMGCGVQYPDLTLAASDLIGISRPRRLAVMESWLYTLNPLEASLYADSLEETLQARWAQVLMEGKVLNLHG